MIDNPGIVGVKLVDEAYDNLHLHVEEFFDVTPENPGWTDALESDTERSHPASPNVDGHQQLEDACIFVCGPTEMAVVEPRRHPVKFLGTSGLDMSIAVLLACPQTGKFGCIHIGTSASARVGVTKLSREVASISNFALQNGATKGEGYLHLQTGSPAALQALNVRGLGRRKAAINVEAYICGGFSDNEGFCESILDEILSSMMDLEYRFVVKMLCAGLMNDSEHNGNDEDKKGPHGPLITACTFKLSLDVHANLIEHVFCPVQKFFNCGPAIELRALRIYQSPHHIQTGRETCEIIPSFSSVYCAETGRFVIEPFLVDELFDVQTVAILLNLAVTNKDLFVQQFSALPHSKKWNQIDLPCRALCLLMENILKEGSLQFPGTKSLFFLPNVAKKSGKDTSFWSFDGTKVSGEWWKLTRNEHCIINCLRGNERCAHPHKFVQ